MLKIDRAHSKKRKFLVIKNYFMVLKFFSSKFVYVIVKAESYFFYLFISKYEKKRASINYVN